MALPYWIMTQPAIPDEQRAFVALFRYVLDAAPDPTLVVNGDGLIIFANGATERILGWPPSALVGQSVECLIPIRLRHDHVAHRERFAARPLMRGMGAGRELLAVRRDGTDLAVEISLSPVPTEHGALTICAVRDISERKRVEKELRNLNAHLEERVVERTLEFQAANQELEMLAYSIAHDLRAPLRAINGFSAQLVTATQGGLSDEAVRRLRIVISRALQMSSMIDDYLRLLAVGRKELVRESLEMDVMAGEALSQIGSSYAGHVLIGSMPSVLGDRTLILDVWRQLLRNAVKFSAVKPTPMIRASAGEDRHFVYFSVEDNGVGFDPTHADKLFRLFERLHAAKDFVGNGIGLCLVKRIVERHGGGVEIKSRPNEGARATFWLPKSLGGSA